MVVNLLKMATLPRQVKVSWRWIKIQRRDLLFYCRVPVWLLLYVYGGGGGIPPTGNVMSVLFMI